MKKFWKFLWVKDFFIIINFYELSFWVTYVAPLLTTFWHISRNKWFCQVNFYFPVKQRSGKTHILAYLMEQIILLGWLLFFCKIWAKENSYSDILTYWMVTLAEMLTQLNQNVYLAKLKIIIFFLCGLKRLVLCPTRVT